jgi:RluA family pseudouridine synthase
VLYEDEDLIAVDKPAGLVMHATADARRDDLYTRVRRLLAARGARPVAGDADGLPYLGLHHRLDVETSGVVLFCKRERANRGLAEQFAAGRVAKTYHAITQRPGKELPRQWTIDNRLAPRGTGRHAQMADTRSGGVHAVTAFTRLDLFSRAMLLEACPATGRKHQIRAHLAESGTPILGDRRYGGPARVGGCQIGRVMLHARQLSIVHPVSGAPLTIDSPYPGDFDHVLGCLRRG